MDKSAESTYGLLETLLIWATNRNEDIENNAQKQDIALAIKSVGKNLQHIAKAKDINLNLDIEEGYIAKFDKNSIDVVIRNLTANALKFTNPNGNVWYTLEKDDSHVIVSVNDDGVGISEENIENILAGNRKKTSLGTKGEKGTGLGLILCKDFIAKNGGVCWIESELGKGSSFKFSLPIGR
jgi:signal transduction histidine kinase